MTAVGNAGLAAKAIQLLASGEKSKKRTLPGPSAYPPNTAVRGICQVLLTPTEDGLDAGAARSRSRWGRMKPLTPKAIIVANGRFQFPRQRILSTGKGHTQANLHSNLGFYMLSDKLVTVFRYLCGIIEALRL